MVVISRSKLKHIKLTVMDMELSKAQTRFQYEECKVTFPSIVGFLNFLIYFEKGCGVTQAVLRLLILIPPHPKNRDSRRPAPSCVLPKPKRYSHHGMHDVSSSNPPGPGHPFPSTQMDENIPQKSGGDPPDLSSRDTLTAVGHFLGCLC